MPSPESIDNMGWVKSNGNLADGLTKIDKVDLIQEVMRTGKLKRVADQWIIRPPVPRIEENPDVRADKYVAPTKVRTKEEPATAEKSTKEDPLPSSTNTKAKSTIV